MTKNTIFLCVVMAILAAIYAVYFTDWFHKETIQIIPTIRPGRPSSIPRDAGTAQVSPVNFAFDGKYRLTSVKVVAADDLKTNKYPTPLWHMISVGEKGSAPQKFVLYGQPIRDMKPAVPRARAQPLQPDVLYVLMIEAYKNIKGQTNFYTREMIQPRPQ